MNYVEVSIHYERFVREMEIKLSTFEKLARKAYELLKIDVGYDDYDKQLEFAEMQIRFKHAFNLAIIVTFLSLPFAFFITAIGKSSITNMFGLMVPILAFFSVIYYPLYRANLLKMKMLGQAPLAILYLVIALEVTPNLESAVAFAARNMADPLGRVFKRLLWEVETRKRADMSEALYAYSAKIKDYLPHFSEALYLVASSPRDIGENRKRTLEKAVSVVLDGTKSTMEGFARSLSLPVMVLNAFGILLPVIMLILGPIASIFVSGGNLGPAFLIIYDFFIPVMLMMIGIYVLGNRPGSSIDIKYRKPDFTVKIGGWVFNGKRLAIVTMVVFLGVQLAIISATGGKLLSPISDIIAYPSISTLPGIIGIAIPLGIYLFSWSYGNSEKKRRVRELERQFSSALYQLSNVLSAGIPLEQAFEEVADKFKGSEIEYFFREAAVKVKKLGWTMEKALFDPKAGVLLQFPSNLIKNVMMVLLKSAEKGPFSASLTAAGISNYLKKMNEVNEKMEDLLAEHISTMKFQGMLLIPLITGTVVGLGEVISGILLQISRQMLSLTGIQTAYVYGSFSELFNVKGVIQPSFLQMVIGIYMIEMEVISGWITGGLEEGWDKVAMFTEMGRMLIIGIAMYALIATMISLMFGGLASTLVV